MTVCICGKNEIAIKALKYLKLNFSGIKLAASCNRTDDGENGWQPSFKKYCLDNGVPLYSLSQLYEIEDLLLISLEFDKIILPQRFKSDRLFNIHFSKLPAYKGMYTSVLPILNGEKETGVTLHYIDKGIDTGAIIDQLSISLSNTITARELYDLYLQYGLTLFERNIQNLIFDRVISLPQPSCGSTYFSKATLSFSELFVDLNKTAYQVHNQVRAFCFRDYQLPRVLGYPIYKSEVIDNVSDGKPGTVSFQNGWYIQVNTVDYQVKLYVDKQDVLMKAAEEGDISQFENLRFHHFPVDIKTKQGWDAMIVASYHNQLSFVKHLVDLGWDVNTKNYKGTTALMYSMTAASKTGDLATLKLLGEKADWTYKDDNGKDIFDYATEYKNPQVIQLVEKYRSH